MVKITPELHHLLEEARLTRSGILETSEEFLVWLDALVEEVRREGESNDEDKS